MDSMQNPASMTEKTKQISRLGNAGFQFDSKATEVSILDRAGRPIWTKQRGEAPTPIRWSGRDSLGRTVETGDYICKISYPNNKVAYLPFVFVRKN